MPYRSLLIPLACVLALGCEHVPDSPLTEAIVEGDPRVVVAVLDAGADPNAPDGTGLTPLIWALREGDLRMVELLLDRGADPDARGRSEWSPLAHSIHTGNRGGVRALLEAGAHGDGEQARIALKMAAGHGEAALVAQLAAHGLEPPTPDAGSGILADAVGGAWDIEVPWRGCEPHEATVRALLAAFPELRLDDDLHARMAVWHARRQGCDEMLALVGEEPAP